MVCMNYRIAMVLLFIFYTPALCAQNKPFTFVPAEEPLSLYKALAYDIVPGGGHIYTGHYEYAAVFATLKISGVYAMYYYYNYWHYRGSLYRSAKKANAAIDPEHDLQFKDPEGGYKTVEEFRHAYDRAAHYFTLSVAANVAIYVTSWLVTAYHVQQINEERQPAYIGFAAHVLLDADAYGTVYAGYTVKW